MLCCSRFVRTFGPMQRKVSVGKTLKWFRMQVGRRQDEVAERAGISKSTLVRIEKGSPSPRFDVVTKILDALGLTLRELALEMERTEEREARRGEPHAQPPASAREKPAGVWPVLDEELVGYQVEESTVVLHFRLTKERAVHLWGSLKPPAPPT